MKTILSGLLLASLLSAGCITFPKGVHPWMRNKPVDDRDEAKTPPASKPAALPAPEVTPTAAPKPPAAPPMLVKPEEVNEENAHQKIGQLEAEIRHDEPGSN